MDKEQHDDAQRTAHRMVSMYGKGRSRYTPEQRATDHAFSYDSSRPERRYWLAVIDAIYKINQGVSP